MSELSLKFELPEGSGVEAEQAAQVLQTQLQQLPSVESVETYAPSARLDAVEVGLILTATITLVSNANEIVDELTKLITNIKTFYHVIRPEKKAEKKDDKPATTPDTPAPTSSVAQTGNTTNITGKNITINNITLDVGFRKLSLNDLDTEEKIRKVAEQLAALQA